MKSSGGYEVFLRGLRFHARHGVLPQERIVGGEFIVDVIVHVVSRGVSSDAVVTDNLNDAADYGAMYEAVRREMAVPSKLLEHVAGRIGRAVLAVAPQAVAADITITKCTPPIGADWAVAGGAGSGVTVHMTKE